MVCHYSNSSFITLNPPFSQKHCQHFLNSPPAKIRKYHTAHCARSAMEGDPLLRDDAFQNEHSRSLFDAIDKLRSCVAKQDLELPEVT